MSEEKQRILEIFNERVRGKAPDVEESRHDGSVGHWLERQFGILHNANNSADILGYELKTGTASKITFGDWSANTYIYKNDTFNHIFFDDSKGTKQDRFARIFGKPNPLKNNRYSWSGQPCPKINKYNAFGQILLIEGNRQDIVVYYKYEEDKREDKSQIIPIEFQSTEIELARWYGNDAPNGRSIREKLENKFNQKGWFTCKRNTDGIYDRICFGDPINFETWIKWVQEGKVFFDSGMYEGNPRPYSQWRMNNVGWDNLIVDSY